VLLMSRSETRPTTFRGTNSMHGRVDAMGLRRATSTYDVDLIMHSPEQRQRLPLLKSGPGISA
jgi:hypothetical protein